MTTTATTNVKVTHIQRSAVQYIIHINFHRRVLYLLHTGDRTCSDVAFEFTYVCRTYTHSISTMLVKNTPSRFQGNISGYSSSHILLFLLYIIYNIYTYS